MLTKDMADIEERPIDALKRWLLHEWQGPYDFIDVRIERRVMGNGREEAWYIRPVIEGGPDTDWDARELCVVDIAVRDKALELGLDFPWFVFVTVSDGDEPMEDDDLPWPDD
jgi:hypothetical protein